MAPDSGQCMSVECGNLVRVGPMAGSHSSGNRQHLSVLALCPTCLRPASFQLKYMWFRRKGTGLGNKMGGFRRSATREIWALEQ